jgi:hypothetical protein
MPRALDGIEMTKQVTFLLIGIVTGCFAILVTGDFRQWIDSLRHYLMPVSARKIGHGGYLSAYYFCNFVLIFCIFIIICVLLVPHSK